MSALEVFRFEGHEIRTVVIDGKPRFVARDVASALGYADLKNAVKQHCKGVAIHHPLETAGGIQTTRVIGEPDLLRMIAGSRLPSAERFERWAFEEVLPTVLRTGSYSAPLSDDEIVQQALAITARRVEQLEAKVAADAPKVEYVETFVAPEDLRILRNVAKSLDMQEEALRDALVRHRWIYVEKTERWSNSEQRKVEVKRYSAYADKREYFRPVPNHDAPRFRGELMHTLKITPQGALAIARAAARWGLTKENADV